MEFVYLENRNFVTKVSGCFRSENGIRDYLAAMSYIGTAKKHGKNAFQAILNVFEGNIFYAIEG